MSQDHATRGFLIHLGVYVLVVGLLAALNLYRNPDNLWFIWVLLGWGIGVAAHGLAILLQRSGRREEMFTDRRKRSFLVHLFTYLS
jgi:2TM domain